MDNILISLTAICNPNCQNGGSCTSPNICDCVNGWSGPTCSAGNSVGIVIFKVPIFNSSDLHSTLQEWRYLHKSQCLFLSHWRLDWH